VSDWSSDVCSSDLAGPRSASPRARLAGRSRAHARGRVGRGVAHLRAAGGVSHGGVQGGRALVSRPGGAPGLAEGHGTAAGVVAARGGRVSQPRAGPGKVPPPSPPPSPHGPPPPPTPHP